MNIFQFVKNKCHQYEYNELINKPIRQKNKQIENEIFLFSNALKSIGFTNFIGDEHKIYAIMNDVKIIFNCNDDSFSNKKHSIINLNTLIEKTDDNFNFDYFIWEELKSISERLENIIPIELMKETKLAYGLNDHGFSDNLIQHGKFGYDKETKSILITASTRAQSDILNTEVYLKFNFLLLKKDVKVSISVMDRETLYNWNDGSFKKFTIEFSMKSDYEIKESIYKKLLPVLLKKEICELLGISKIEEFTDEMFENYKLLNY